MKNFYHATYEKLLPSIKQQGLIGGKHKWWNDSKDVVYLSDDPYVAESFAETSDLVPEEWLGEIVILKIKNIDLTKLRKDRNNQGEHTFEYHGTIHPKKISIFQNMTEGKKMSLAALALAALGGVGGYQLAKYNDTQRSKNDDSIHHTHHEVDYNDLFDQIKQHEGIRRRVYTDYRGHPTIGIGFNLDSNINQQFLSKVGIDLSDLLRGQPLTDDQIKVLYDFSIRVATKDAESLVSNFHSQPEVVQRILIDMSFNMGRNKLSKFRGMINAVERGDYRQAAMEMKFQNGKDGRLTPWYTQTGNRSKRLVNWMMNI